MGNPLTVVLQIAADSSQATAQLEALPAEVQASVQSSAAAFSGLKGGTDVANQGILTARESTRLLGEEFGIHLPRAVSSAVSGMLPEIASLGTGLLAVFAVEEVVKFAGEVHKLTDEFNGAAEAEKLLKMAANENLSAMEEAAKKSEKYAQDQIRLLQIQIAAQQVHVNTLRDENEGMLKWLPEGTGIAAIAGQIVQAYHFWTGGTKDLKQATDELTWQQQLLDKVVKILGEDEDIAHKKATEAAKRHAEELKRLAEAEERFREALVREQAQAERRNDRLIAEGEREAEKALKDWTKAVNQSGLAAASALPPLTALGTGVKQLTEAERAALPLSNDLGMAIQREAQRLREMRAEMDGGTLPAMKRIDLAYHKQMDTAKQQIQLMQQEYQQQNIIRAQMEAAEEAYTEIVVDSAAIRTGAIKQEMLQQASSLASQLGLEQEFIIAEAAYMIPKNLAEGFAALGQQDYWAATQYFLSAAQWGVAAGKAVNTIASGGRGGGGAGGAGAGGSTAGPAGAGSSSAYSSQPTTNSVIRVELPPGGEIPVGYVRDLINQINTQVQYNGVTLHATYSRSLAPRA